MPHRLNDPSLEPAWTRVRDLGLLSMLLMCAFAPAARAQTGVSDERVVLPDGPGSIDGIGDNVSVEANMGAMSYAVPIEVPAGHAGMTPELALRYSSTAGASVIGVGWSFAVPSIERLTLRGLPEYDRDDEMAANGGEQLVRVEASSSTATYRARFERAFVRYTWHAVGDGRGGYWTAEWPDGRVGYFGADADGESVPEARLEQAGDTFRWLLVEVVDPFDHRLRYEYDAAGGTPLLTRVHWVHDAGGDPRYAVELEHAPRPDPISDASPGFEGLLRERLVALRVRARGEVIRTYRLTYEDEATSGGVSRLARVERFGRAGGLYPVVHSFAYSRSLSGVCGAGSTAACDRPFVVDMGSVPGAGGIGRGDATLIDIDGDALPDVLDTSLERHRFYLNRLDDGGQGHFEAAARESVLGTRTPFALAQASVQVLDVNGDGFADLVDALGGDFLCNLGGGDWADASEPANAARCGTLSPITGVPMELDEVGGAGDPDPLRTRFVDLDGDRRIDILRTDSASQTHAWVNTPAGFVEIPGVEPLGAQFDGDALQLADMNGDGLLDAVWIDSAGAVLYRLSYGRGRFSRDTAERAWRVAAAPPIGSAAAVQLVQLEDLNGDGLDDLVLVEGSTVSVAVNRNVGRFDPWLTIDATDVPELPARLATTTVLFADMNGTGSRDVVWVEQSGRVRYLEIFPVRPNLLARVENGIGSVQTVTYGRSVMHHAQSDEPWAHALPNAMAVVDRTDTWVTLTGGEGGEGLHEVVEYAYTDGFYDGVEKAFRGFGHVERRTLGDVERDGQEPSRTVETYDLGADDAYRASLLLTRQVFSGVDERALLEERHTHEDCPLEEVGSGTRFPVRHVCETEVLTIHQEGMAPEAWATTRTETTYDGYGDATLTVEHGVVHMGPPEAPLACGACASSVADRFSGACGEACLGDERYSERAYIEPGTATSDRWILGASYRERTYADPEGPASETRTFYDGPDFVGLAEGRLDRGRVTRVLVRASEEEEIALDRSALDAHGNVVASLDPLGDPSLTGGHRRAYTFDEDGLRLVRTEVFLTTPEGEPYRLRQEYAYEAALDRVIESSGWMIEGAGRSSARNPTYYGYDEHARLVAIARPGDTLDAPSLAVSWELGDPATRVVIRQRSGAEAPDVETARCLDGRGRVFQELTRVREGEWLATGFIVHNRRGATVSVYQPYTVPSGACATAPPEGVLHVDVAYDGLEREVRRRLPDGALHPSASEQRHEYLPLAERVFDADDLDLESPHQGTPELTRMDGLGRPIALERLLLTDAGMERAVTALFYDGRGNLAGFVDAAGNEKRQTFDLAGRLLRVDDPSTGTTTFEHDAAGNLIARTDARGVTARMEHDGANRPVARYDARDPEGTRVTMRYDFAPGCEGVACANGEGRLVESTYPLPDAILARVGGSGGADRRGYDTRGRAVREERRIGEVSFVLEETLDGLDRPIETRFPDGQVMRRRFDGASRLVEIEGLIARVEHDARGRIARVVRADGSDETMEHDALMRLARMSSVAGGGAVLVDSTFERDRRGQILEVESAAGLEGALDAGTTRYAYDSLHRLVGADTAVGQPHEERLAFEYDLLDNLLSATSTLDEGSRGHVGAFVYGERPSIATQIGAIGQTHDEAGFLVARDGMELEWDFLGRLREARADGEARGVFAYGADQQRVAKLEDGALTIYVSRDFEIRDGVSRAYARIGRDRVARSQSTALAAALYDDPDGDGAITAADGLAEADAVRRDAVIRASARGYLHEAAPEPVHLYHDHLGSVVAATREGEVMGRRAFHPFGELRAERGFVDEHGFTGQERDASTGLSAFEWRYLDTWSGRWASADPGFEAIGDLRALPAEHVARYGYVRGDPTNTIDPLGLVGEGTTTDPQNRQYERLLRLVTHALDFSSPRDGAVFWSTPNSEVAAEWAAKNNKTTLEQTAGGQFLNQLKLFGENSPLLPEQAAHLWDVASRRFAEQASGEVHVFKDHSTRRGPHGERTFPRVEHPALRRNFKVTAINYRRGSAGHLTGVERLFKANTSAPRR